jgi:hypothetical protein
MDVVLQLSYMLLLRHVILRRNAVSCLRRTHPTYGCINGGCTRGQPPTGRARTLRARCRISVDNNRTYSSSTRTVSRHLSPRSLRAYLSCDAAQISVCHITIAAGGTGAAQPASFPASHLGSDRRKKSSRASGYGEKIGLAHCPNPSHRFSLASASRGHSDGNEVDIGPGRRT